MDGYKNSRLIARKYSKMREMKKLVVSVIIIGILLWRCDGCLDYERNALMELSASFHLSRDYMVGDDCCEWRGPVKCSSSSHRVTQLSIYGFEMEQSENYYFNASLFLPFHQLNTLRIYFINIAGCVHNQCFERLSELQKLESLDLFVMNFMNRSILSSIASILSLRSLSLIDVGLEGTDEIQWLSKLEKLEHLDLSDNNFNDAKLLFPFIQELMVSGTSLKNLSLEGNEIESFGGGCAEFKNFITLELLDLSYNSLNNSILSSLNHCFSLKYLYIDGNKLQGSINLEELNALANLEVLGLSRNQIDRIVGSRGVNVSRNLRALYLDEITPNGRSNVELHSLGAYPHLKTISLTGNPFEGPIFVQEGNLTNVEELFLNYSSLDQESFQSLSTLPSLKYLSLYNVHATQPAQGLSNLTKLEYLDMSSCAVDSSFLKDIGRMTSLETLILPNSGLKGTLPTTEGLCKLKHLEELVINENKLSGILPQCVANLTSLKKLDLSWNHFFGNISPLSSLTSLQELILSNNHFQVPISLEPFFNHSKLKYLDARNNSQIYDDEMDVHYSSPKFQLQTLLLSGPGNGKAFPKFLYHQHDLQKVDISSIQLNETFPCWLLVNNTNLSRVLLANTSLSGPFQLPIDSHKYLNYLDISNNYLNGTILTNIGQVLPNLYFLNLSKNGFMGAIPSSFGKMSGLSSLDISYNQFSGKIPEDLYVGYFSLSEVIFSHNDFEGQIFPQQANLNYLEKLLFNGNKFTGNIPNSLLNCTRLSILDVSNNHLSGNIPGWIANMSYLEVLDLSSNSFSKNLPSHFCPSAIKEVYLSNNQLQGSLGNVFYNCTKLMTLVINHNHLIGKILDWIGKLSNLSYIILSHNKLQGALPIEFCNLRQLSLVDLSNNNLSGNVLSCLRCSSKSMQPEMSFDQRNSSSLVRYMQQPLEFTTKNITYEFQGSILKYISGMDLSCNNFTGEIPIEIGNLSMIQVLNLSHNSLTGPIPQSFANLKEIESLDLSYNKLNGKIPPQLTQLTFLSIFSVAHNNLSGKIPEMVRQFATFDNSSYEGNPFLCGLPLLKSCQPKDSPTNPVKEEKEEEGGVIDMTDFYVSFLISYVTVLLSIAAVLYINPYWRRAWFYIIEVSLRNCYYFIEDIILALRKLRAP